MKKNIIFFLLFLLPSLVLAASPFAETTRGDGLQLEYPILEWVQTNTELEISVHVYNLEDGVAEVTGVNCTLHVYNETGNHIYTNWTTEVDHLFDYEFEISSSLITEPGKYALGVYCVCDVCGFEGSELGGFFFESFYANDEGEPKSQEGLGFLAILIMIPIILGLFFLIGAATLGEEHNVLRIVLFLLSVPMTWISLHFGMIGLVRYYQLEALQNAIGSFTYWTAWLFFVLISYFVIYTIWKATEVAAQKKEERLRY